MNRSLLSTLAFGILGVALTATPAEAQRGRVGVSFGNGGYYGPGRGYGYGYGNNFYGNNYYGNRGFGNNFYGNGYGYNRPYSGFGIGIGNPGGYGYGTQRYSNYSNYPIYSGNTYSQPGYYNNSGYVVDSQTYQQPSTSESLYAMPAAQGGKARLRVTVPTPETKLMVNGAATSQTGLDRIFESPNLEGGRQHTYTLEAVWTVNGQEVVRKQDVNVVPGQETTVTFAKETGVTTQQ